MSDLVRLLPLLLIVAVLYLLMVRPARNRQRQMAALQQRVTVGSQVLTTAGLYGTVVAMDDESVTLETSPGVTSRWTRGAVGRLLSDDELSGGELSGGELSGGELSGGELSGGEAGVSLDKPRERPMGTQRKMSTDRSVPADATPLGATADATRTDRTND